GRVAVVGRHRRREDPREPGRESRGVADPAAHGHRNPRPGRDRTDEPAAGRDVRRVPAVHRLPRPHPGHHRPLTPPHLPRERGTTDTTTGKENDHSATTTDSTTDTVTDHGRRGARGAA